jgi:hypothetical protein
MVAGRGKGEGPKKSVRETAAKVLSRVGEVTGASIASEVRDFAEVYGEILLGLHDDLRTLEVELHSSAASAGTRLEEFESRMSILEGAQVHAVQLTTRLGVLEQSALAASAGRARWTLLMSALAIAVSVGVALWTLVFGR